MVDISIDSRIKRIYDHLYANASVRTPSGIAVEVGKLLRTASYIEKGEGVFPAFSFSESIKRQVSQGDREVIVRLAEDVRKRFEEMKTAWNLYSHEEILLADPDIAWSCVQLDSVVVSSKKRDVYGDAVEIFRTSWAKQSSGQFFTDWRVTHLAMDLLEFDPFSGDDLVDICCGTGGFLLAGLDKIREKVDSLKLGRDGAHLVSETANKCLRGQEVDPEICEVANASLSSRIGGTSRLLIEKKDSLMPLPVDEDSQIRLASHLCAASNPPFGTKITVKNPDVLQKYDLARSSSGRITPRAPDILFLEQNVRLLTPGRGRLAIVTPYQILSGPQTRFIREWLLKHTILVGVVDLPLETFQPHTGTKTSLLIVKRRETPLKKIEEAEEHQVFMATPQWIGHDRRGNPVYRRLPDSQVSSEILSDIEDVGQAFKVFRMNEKHLNHSECFTINMRTVAADPDLRLNARYYKTHTDNVTLPKSEISFKTIRLGAAFERIFYPGRFKRNYVEKNDCSIPFLGGANISQLIVSTDKWLGAEDPHLRELVVKAGWILVTRSGTTGIISSVPKAWDGYAISEHVIRMVPKANIIDPEWIIAFLRSTRGQQELSRGVFGSVIDEITPEFISNLNVPLPPSDSIYQQVISSIRDAESSRQKAIEQFSRGILTFQNSLGMVV